MCDEHAPPARPYSHELRGHQLHRLPRDADALSTANTAPHHCAPPDQKIPSIPITQRLLDHMVPCTYATTLRVIRRLGGGSNGQQC
eukprot:2194674-Pyramimonas_sp.AAC.1